MTASPFVTADMLAAAHELECEEVVANSEQAARLIRSAPPHKQLKTFLMYASHLTDEHIQDILEEAIERDRTPPHKVTFIENLDPYMPLFACVALTAAMTLLHLHPLWVVSSVVWLGYSLGYALWNQPMAAEMRMALAMQVALIVPEISSLSAASFQGLHAGRLDQVFLGGFVTVVMALGTYYITKRNYRRH